MVAFAITLTRDGNHLDGAAVLAASIGESWQGRGLLSWDQTQCRRGMDAAGCLVVKPGGAPRVRDEGVLLLL